MNTRKDINDFISITKSRDGRMKISHNVNNEGNIYKFLSSIGFGQTKLDRKRVYYRRIDGDIIPVAIYNIKDEFSKYLKELRFDNILYSDIMNWYYKKDPIKRNGLFFAYLESPLLPIEEHIYKLKTDIDYKHDIEIKAILNVFKEKDFKKSIDKKGLFCKDAILYYKKVKDFQYLIFAHFNHDKKKWKDGFDCYMATYLEKSPSIEKHIPTSLETVKLSFKIEQDFKVIDEYFA